MTMFYVFEDDGNFVFETYDEAEASAWCDNHEGYYCADGEDE